MSFPKKGRVLFTATGVRGFITRFLLPYLKWFKGQGWEVWVAAKNDFPDGWCDIPYCDRFIPIAFARNPFSRDNKSAYRQLCSLFSSERFDIVHTHTPVGSVLTRLAARDARRKGTKIIYTAHGFHFFDGAPLSNWLLWYLVERTMSRFCDCLVTINQEDRERAMRFAYCRVEYVPGVGIDLSRFRPSVGLDNRRIIVRRDFGLLDDDFVLFVVGEMIPRKNQKVIVDALSLLPENVKLFICGDGPLQGDLAREAASLGVSQRVRFLGYRDDVNMVMLAGDALVHPSFQEGLPVAVMEAMASGLPVIASAIRGIVPDLIEPGVNGLAVEHPDAKAIADMVCSLQQNSSFAASLAAQAYEDVQRFDVDRLLERYGELYESLY